MANPVQSVPVQSVPIQRVLTEKVLVEILHRGGILRRQICDFCTATRNQGMEIDTGNEFLQQFLNIRKTISRQTDQQPFNCETSKCPNWKASGQKTGAGWEKDKCYARSKHGSPEL